MIDSASTATTTSSSTATTTLSKTTGRRLVRPHISKNFIYEVSFPGYTGESMFLGRQGESRKCILLGDGGIRTPDTKPTVCQRRVIACFR